MSEDMDEKDEFTALAAEYALGLLTPAEADAFEEIMATDPELRETYALWAEDFASITEGIEPVEPPATVLAAITEQLFPDAEKPKQSLLARFGLLPAIVGGLVAAGAVLFVVDQVVMSPDVPAPWVYVAAIEAADGSLNVQAACDPKTRILTLERVAGAATEGRSLQAWLLAEGAEPVPLTVLAEAGVTTFVMPEALMEALWKGEIAISDEPAGGSPTGQPTGDILAVGSVVKA